MFFCSKMAKVIPWGCILAIFGNFQSHLERLEKKNEENRLPQKWQFWGNTHHHFFLAIVGHFGHFLGHIWPFSQKRKDCKMSILFCVLPSDDHARVTSANSFSSLNLPNEELTLSLKEIVYIWTYCHIGCNRICTNMCKDILSLSNYELPQLR